MIASSLSWYKLSACSDMIIKRASSVDEALKTTKGEAFVARMRQELPALGRAAASGDNVCGVTISKDNEKEECEEAGLSAEYFRFSECSFCSHALDLAFVNRTRFDYCALSKASGGSAAWDSCFASNIEGVTSGMITSKRTLAIAKEMGTMSQNLPAAWESSVFIRSVDGRIVPIATPNAK